MSTAIHRRLFLLVVLGLAAFAWVALALWHRTPYAHYLHGDGFEYLDLACTAPPVALGVGLYVGGWLVMTVAMMLPTTLPLIEIFLRLTRQHRERGLLAALLVLGYLAVWMAFGFAAQGLNWSLHQWFERDGWLQVHSWLFAAVPLGLAGAFQFSSLKYRCLDQCRSPLAFVVGRWGGERQRWRAFRIGADHGVYCVGCCWALMLLMFVVGAGHLGWMLALAVVMAVEKNVAWGRRLAAPLGVALLAAAALVTIEHLPMPA